MDRYCWTEYGMLKTVEISDSFYRHGNADKEIEQLKNEKEWLKYQILLYQEFHPGLPYDEKMELLEVDMQKALKEGE